MNILIAGASGIVGQALLALLLQDNKVTKIISIGRKKLALKHPKLETYIQDFENLEKLEISENIDIAFCCLGTTLKTAGSKANFYKVDLEYVVNFAQLALKLKIPTFAVISAMKVSEKSLFFYNRVKAEMEKTIAKLPFEQIKIFKPSLLMAKNRKENRFGEQLAIRLMSYLRPILPKKYQGVEPEIVAQAMWKYAQQKYTTKIQIIENQDFF